LNIFKEFNKVCRDLEDISEEKRLNRTIRKLVETRLENEEKLSAKDKELGELRNQQVSHNFSLILPNHTLKG